MKFTLTLAGELEAEVRRLAEARGIDPQEAVRSLLGDAIEFRRRVSVAVLSSPETSSDVQRIPQTSPGVRGQVLPEVSPLSPSPAPSPPLSPSYPSPENPPLSPRRARPRVQRVGNDLDGFEEFWANYFRRRRVNRKAAADAYAKLSRTGKLPPLPVLLAALARQAPLYESCLPEHIPHARTWLNQERWEDETPAPPLAANVGGDPPARQTDRVKTMERLVSLKRAIPPAEYDSLLGSVQHARTARELADASRRVEGWAK